MGAEAWAAPPSLVPDVCSAAQVIDRLLGNGGIGLCSQEPHHHPFFLGVALSKALKTLVKMLLKETGDFLEHFPTECFRSLATYGQELVCSWFFVSLSFLVLFSCLYKKFCIFKMKIVSFLS